MRRGAGIDGGVSGGLGGAGWEPAVGSEPISMVPWAALPDSFCDFAFSEGLAWAGLISIVPLNIPAPADLRGLMSASQLVQRDASSAFFKPQFEQ
ncbi:MAG: hypothetical protein H6714_04040 [Myxococcales bacterium]|nr:hypothetical protein [Myxococcales bacterium]